MMIPIEVLKKVSVIYTHGHCPDGLASAMILKDAFRMLGMSPRIEFLVHGTPEHRAAFPSEDGLTLFCDIAPVKAQSIPMGSAIVLDHHVGAREIVESFGSLGVYADAEKEPGVSGAVLAFREVWLSTFAEMVNLNENVADSPQHDRVRDFALCVGARDTWQTQDGRFQRGQWISKMLMSKPASHWLGGTRRVELENGAVHDVPERAVLPYLHESEVEMGRALFEAHEESVRQAVEQCVSCSVQIGNSPGYIALFVFQEQASGFRLCSDVAEALRSNAKTHGGGEVPAVVAGFSYVVDKPGDNPRLLYSLRGLSGFDVQKFATANGGGGHKAAAGFSCDGQVGDPYGLVRVRLAAFLRGGDT